MAAGTVQIYNASKANFFRGDHDWDAANHYAHLLQSAYTPAATHDTWADVSAQEITDGDYSAVLMAGEAVNGGTGTATGNCDANNVNYGTSVTITARYLVVRQGTATPGTSDPVTCYVELETTGDVSSTNGTFEVQWPATGLWQFS